MRLRDRLSLATTPTIVGLAAVCAVAVAPAARATGMPTGLPSGLEGNCTFAGCDIAYWSPASGGNGHYYAFVPTVDAPPTWTAARDSAAGSTLGAGTEGYLATISSAAENAFIDQLLPLTTEGHKRQVWLGGFQNDTPVKSLPPDVGWQWVGPESWNYTNWLPGEPNDENAAHTGDERYLAMWVHYYVGQTLDYSGTWNDEGLDSQEQAPIVGFIAEYDARVPEPAEALLALLGAAALIRRSARLTR
ncbi:MAG: hypothetical protein ACHQ6T_08800 [Myxococcota bacterium]